MADNVTITASANAGVPANTVFSTVQMTGGAHIQNVLAGPADTVTKEWTFTTAQTDFALVSVGAGNKIVVTSISATLDEATTVSGVGIRIGFAATTLPGTSTTGATGIFLSHPGLVPGSGLVLGNGAGIIGQGGDAEDIRASFEVPTGGSLRIVISYSVRPS